MNRLEMILLRFAGTGASDLVSDIRRSVAAAEVRVYRRSDISGDVAVHILVDAGDAGAAPSELGVRLAAALRKHGMVEHSVWIEEQR